MTACFLTVKMPKGYVAPSYSNKRNLKEGISLNKLSFYGDDRPEAKKRRQKWVNFVRLKHAKSWKPSQSSLLYLEHFKRDDFIRSVDLGDKEDLSTSQRWLKTDDLGVSVFPCVQVKNTCTKCKAGVRLIYMQQNGKIKMSDILFINPDVLHCSHLLVT